MITQSNYYSLEVDREYISKSQITAFKSCPAREIARLQGDYEPETKRAFLLGQYVDVALTEPEKFEEWKKETEGILKKDGKPYKDFEDCNEMIESIENDPVFMKILEGEKQVVLTGEINGAKFKCMLDVLNLGKERFVDLKTDKDFSDSYDAECGYRLPWYETYHYWRQMGIYQELIRQNHCDTLPVIAGVTKQSPPAKEIVSFDNQPRLDYEVETVEAFVPQILEWKESGEAPMCEKCDYCRKERGTIITTARSER